MRIRTTVLGVALATLAVCVAGCGPGAPAISKEDLKNIKGGPPPPGLNIGQKMAETRAKWHAAHPEYDKYDASYKAAPQAPANVKSDDSKSAG